jgi:hypothetical protein
LRRRLRIPPSLLGGCGGAGGAVFTPVDQRRESSARWSCSPPKGVGERGAERAACCGRAVWRARKRRSRRRSAHVSARQGTPAGRGQSTQGCRSCARQSASMCDGHYTKQWSLDCQAQVRPVWTHESRHARSCDAWKTTAPRTMKGTTFSTPVHRGLHHRAGSEHRLACCRSVARAGGHPRRLSQRGGSSPSCWRTRRV